MPACVLGASRAGSLRSQMRRPAYIIRPAMTTAVVVACYCFVVVQQYSSSGIFSSLVSWTRRPPVRVWSVERGARVRTLPTQDADE